MKRTRNISSGIEILLVLCCLVGVIVFLAFAMAVLGVGAQMEEESHDVPSLTAERDSLLAESDRKAQEASRLGIELSGLKARERDIEDEIDRIDQGGARKARESLEEEIGRLKKELEEIKNLIEMKKRELERIQTSLRDVKERKKETAEIAEELKSLEGERDALTDTIAGKEREYALLSASVDTTLLADVDRLTEEIEEAKRHKQELLDSLSHREEEANTFNPWRDFDGAAAMTKPLFVECKKGIVVFHPEGRIVTAADLDARNPFSTVADRYESVVFLVRPDGFEVFETARELVKGKGVKLAYEPVDADWKLDFSGRR